MHFSSSKHDVAQYLVLLQDTQLSWSDTITYLGHVLYANNNDSADISVRLNNFISQVNYFFARFGHVSADVRSRLFNNFCTSFYGCDLWDLHHKDLASFDIAWRKAVRRLWHLPYRTHSALLPCIMNERSFCDIICSRFNNFVSSCLKSTFV